LYQVYLQVLEAFLYQDMLCPFPLIKDIVG